MDARMLQMRFVPEHIRAPEYRTILRIRTFVRVHGSNNFAAESRYYGYDQLSVFACGDRLRGHLLSSVGPCYNMSQSFASKTWLTSSYFRLHSLPSISPSGNACQRVTIFRQIASKTLFPLHAQNHAPAAVFLYLGASGTVSPCHMKILLDPNARCSCTPGLHGVCPTPVEFMAQVPDG